MIRLALLLLLSVAACQPVPPVEVPAPALAQVRIIDGDTFELNGETIRIANIDAPEKGRRAKCWAEARLAQEATFGLQMAALDWTVNPPDLQREGRDRYGRTLARVRSHGEDVGEGLIRDGLAAPWRGRRFAWCDALGGEEADRLASAPAAPAARIIAEAQQ